MSAPYIIYNGVSSADLGLIVERLPDFHRAQRRVSEKTVPGRSGAVVQDEGGYDLYTAPVRLNCNGRSLMEVYAWLRGEGWLISSDEPDFKAYVYAYNSITDDRFRAGGAFDSLTINLRVEPYLRLVDEPALVFTEAAAFPGVGHDPSAPLIRVEGSGNINLLVNGATVYLNGVDGAIAVDCEAGIAYTQDGDALAFAGSQVELEDGEWPALRPEGETNLINWSGSVTRVTVQPNWRFL